MRHLFRPVRLDRPTQGSMARRGLLSMTGVATQGAVRFLTNVLVGRLGGPAVLGNVASAISTAQLLALLWPTTTGSAASKFIARARGKTDSDEGAAVASHLARRTIQAALFLAAVATPIWVLLDGGRVIDGAIVALLVVAYSGYSFTRGILFGSGQVARATAWDLMTGFLGLVGITVSLIAGVRGLAVLIPLAAAYCVYTLAGWPWGARGRPVASLRRELDQFVMLGVVGTLASAGFLQLSMIVARLSDGAANAGQYAAAMSLATPPSMLVGSLSLVLFPSMSEAWARNDLEAFRRQVDKATRMLIVVMVAVFGILVLSSELLVSVVWGEQYAQAADLVPILLTAVLATTLAVPSVSSLTSRTQRGMVTATVIGLVGMAIGVGIWAVLAPHLGVTGVAVGYLVGTLTIAGSTVTVSWRRDKQRWKGLIFRLGCGVAAFEGLLVAQREIGLPQAYDLAFVALFLCAWILLMRSDIRRLDLVGLVRGRRR